MNAIAQRARNAALSLEVKKDGLQQRQSGDWVLRLTVHPNDMPMPVMQAAMGTRYQCVLVEVDENEQPKGGDANANTATNSIATAPGQATTPDRARPWNQLAPAQQAGMLCADPIFRAYLKEVHRTYRDTIISEELAAKIVREHCGVKSRADINKSDQATWTWHDLVSDYRAWRREPAVIG